MLTFNKHCFSTGILGPTSLIIFGRMLARTHAHSRLIAINCIQNKSFCLHNICVRVVCHTHQEEGDTEINSNNTVFNYIKQEAAQVTHMKLHLTAERKQGAEHTLNRQN